MGLGRGIILYVLLAVATAIVSAAATRSVASASTQQSDVIYSCVSSATGVLLMQARGGECRVTQVAANWSTDDSRGETSVYGCGRIPNGTLRIYSTNTNCPSGQTKLRWLAVNRTSTKDDAHACVSRNTHVARLVDALQACMPRTSFRVNWPLITGGGSGSQGPPGPLGPTGPDRSSRPTRIRRRRVPGSAWAAGADRGDRTSGLGRSSRSDRRAGSDRSARTERHHRCGGRNGRDGK